MIVRINRYVRKFLVFSLRRHFNVEVLLFVQGPARDSLADAKSDIVVKVILLYCWSSCSWFHWRKWDTGWYLWNNLKQRSCYATHFWFCTGLSFKSNKLEHSVKTVFLGVLIYSVFSCCGVYYDDMIQADNLEKIFSHMKPNSILGFPCKRE